MSSEDEELKHHAELTERYEHLVSSEIIQRCVLIEAALETIIAFHFCDDRDKFLSLRSLLFKDGEIPFSKKIKICQKLMKESYPETFKQVAPLFKRLDERVRPLRNLFAHSKFIPPRYDKPELNMEYYKDGKIIQELVDSPKNKAIIAEAVGCHFSLLLIEGDMERQRANKTSKGLPPNIMRTIAEKWPTLLKKTTALKTKKT